MRDLVKKSLERWRRASRAGAPPAERMEALCTIPELCTALEAVTRSVGGDAPPDSGEDDRERFARHVAHEIRNRLNMVEVALMRLETTGGLEDPHAALEPLRGALRNLSGAVEDLGGIDDAGRHPAFGDGSTAPLGSLVRDLVSASAGLAEEQGIDLEVAEDLPNAPVHAARCELALVNLLSNALDHFDPAKGRRRVRIEVEPWEDDAAGAAWRIGVLDNGVGIPEGLRERVFDESVRGKGGREGGSGLGLTVAREAVEREGGRIWLESEEGAGTAVYFTLPERP